MLGRGTRKGERFPDKSPLHRLRLLRRHAARVLPQGHRHHRRAARAGPTRTIAEIIEDIWAQPRPRLQHRLPGQAPAAHRQGDGRRGPRAVRGLRPRRRPRAASPASCRGALRDDFSATMKLPARPGVPGPARELPAAAARLPRRLRASRTRSTSDWLVRDGDGQRVQARGLPRRLRPVRPREPGPDRGDPHPARPPAGLEHRARSPSCAQKLAAARQRFTVENLQKAHELRYQQGPRGHHLDGQARRPTSSSRC